MTAAPSYAPAIPQETEPPPLMKFAFLCFCIFNVANYSRIFEWQLVWLHVPLITSSIALLGAAMEGRLLRAFSTRIGMCMAALTALYAVNIVFSSWRGGSVGVFTGEWLKSLLVFSIATALIFTFRQCCSAINSIGWGTGIASLLVIFTGGMIQGRLSVGARGATFGNANAIALDMLLGLPCLWLMIKDSNSGKLKKLIAPCLMASSVYALLQTGSRAGLIGFVVLVLLLFVRASAGGKIVMIVAGILAVACAVTILPSSVKLRYLSIFSGSEAGELAQQEGANIGGAVESAEGRRIILLRSLELSLKHPIFGVGIGQFASFEAKTAINGGSRAAWLGTHNTYTQVSSEAGLPALILFLSIILLSFKGLRALSKRARRIAAQGKQVRDVSNVAFALTATLTAYAICVFFDFVAYGTILPTLAAFTIALTRCGNLELDRLEQAAVPQPDRRIALPTAPYAGWARPMRPAVYR